MKTAVVVPTCNAAPWLDRFIPALRMQSPPPDEVLIIDSSSDDGTSDSFRNAGYAVHTIRRNDFNHGGTRQLATTLVPADIYVFLTQDALLHSADAVALLTAPLKNSADIGLCYGRQLPLTTSRPLGQFARLFNYPEVSTTKSISDAPRLGIKTCFASDSFAAYRNSALRDVGGFPRCVIGTEDAHVAGRMLLAGWKIRYESLACVQHCHDYSVLEQFRRYFDIGVFYGQEQWIRDCFGTAGGEGLRFLTAEIRYLIARGEGKLISSALAHNLAKIAGYWLGIRQQWLPGRIKKGISMNRGFWDQINEL